ncbi:MAG TPA: PAAR domain-containing protein [Pyrinomonadaceae bacterium]
MPFAARMGDPTSHGKPLSPGPGSTNVLIGGKPAWRATTDFHACPLVTVTVPHVGGTVAMGSTTVLINNMPAARQGDMIVESGPPNSIAMGEPTVIIG